ncbi:helix-turn-helix domain-containing protein [Enterococcus sp. 669A]|uniref:Helix-turn-helix domain-containing protein n=1 Tax=Candidatus Enterococcus moelleringii TaxID=2815325 RepID=A0ABS3L5K2_9ENTE|nr:helix-turn-helix domain-containing protein [Enterococcus sp. 669A]MBO1304899.1 helix-turn-helix domain-containing protein [Enterococcus sp. 669A]
MFEEIMFDSVAQLKFRIFKNLAGQLQGSYTYNQLAAETNLSYQQFYKLAHEINDELLANGLLQESIIVPNTGIATTNLSLTIDEYRYFLLENSLPFQLMRALLLKPELGLEGFCQQQFASRSTLSRRTQPLIKYLRRYQITINFQQFKLTGQETAIRLVFFYFFWIGYRNLRWPFEISKADAETYGAPFLKFSPLEKNFVGKLEAAMYSAVALTRISQKKIVAYDPAMDFLFVGNKRYDLDIYAALFDLSHEESQGEAASVYFLTNFLPFYESKSDPAIQQTITLFTRKSNVIWEFVEAFREFVLHELRINLDDETRDLMMANLANIVLAFYGFRGPFPNLPYLMKKPSPKSSDTLLLEEKISSFLYKITDQAEFSIFRPSIQPLIAVLRNGVSSYYYKLVKDQPLKVGVVVESNLMLVKPLSDFLLGINFIEAEYYKKEHTYDFIITTFSKLETSAVVYHWDYNEGYQHMGALYTALREAYLRKNR